MTDDALDRVTERLRMARMRRTDDQMADAAARRTAALRGTGQLPIGARVFDVLLGQDGTIVAPPPGNAPTLDRVFVKFDSGITNARAAKDLLVRPTPPAPRS